MNSMFDYLTSLSTEDEEKLLIRLILRLMDTDQIRFCEGEDPNYRGTYTLNPHFYWTSDGEDVLAEPNDNNV